MGAPVTVEVLSGMRGFEEIFTGVVDLVKTGINAGVAIDQGNKTQTAAQSQADAAKADRERVQATLDSLAAMNKNPAPTTGGGPNVLLWVGGGVAVLGVLAFVLMRRK